MAVTVVKQFVATMNANSSFVWRMTDLSPGFNPRIQRDANPKWIVQWQAVPVLTDVDIDSPGIELERLGIAIVEVVIVKEGDNLTHQITLVCKDLGRPPSGSRSVLTYALFAVFIDP